MERRVQGEGSWRTKRQKRAKTFPVPLPDAACLPVPQVKLHQCVEAHNLQEGGVSKARQNFADTSHLHTHLLTSVGLF